MVMKIRRMRMSGRGDGLTRLGKGREHPDLAIEDGIGDEVSVHLDPRLGGMGRDHRLQ